MYNQTEILTNLKKERKRIEAELMKINKAIFALEPVPIQYMEWKQKALDCIHGFECYAQTIEILNCVFINEPYILEDEVLRRRYIVGLSVALNDLCKTGVIKKFRLFRVKGDFYGFPQWFNEDGSLKKKYFSPKLQIMGRDINELILKTTPTYFPPPALENHQMDLETLSDSINTCDTEAYP